MESAKRITWWLCAAVFSASVAHAGEGPIGSPLPGSDVLLYRRCAKAVDAPPSVQSRYSVACLIAAEPPYRARVGLASEPEAKRGPGGPGAAPTSADGLSYPLTDRWTARLTYAHPFLFDRAAADVVRHQPLADFSTSYERDVVNLQMSWKVSWSRLDLGYRFQSTRPGGPDTAQPEHPGYGGLLPESQATMHSIMFGVTKEWGGAP